MSYSRKDAIRSLHITAAMALLCACGAPASTLAPDLPGRGTEHIVLPPKPATVAVATPVDPWAGHTMLEAPVAAPATALVLPTIERFTLKNGLKVIAVHDSSLPVTSLQLAVRAGKRQVSREKVGLASFVAETMTRGTKTRSAARIAREIEAVGGELQSTASFDATLLSCKTLSRDLHTCLSVVADILRNANFPKSEVDLVRRNLEASVRQRFDDAGQLASAHFQSALWGDNHVRGWIMSARTIEAISREDLVAWHKAQIVPNNAILAISGDYNPKTIHRDLERSVGRWRRGHDLATPPMQALPKRKGLLIRLVNKPGQTQSHIRIGNLGIAHNDPTFYGAVAFNYSLGGGGFSSRLMKVVRSAEGKAYSASSNFDRNREVGAFVASTFTRSAETVATVTLMQQVIAAMEKSGPTTEELSAATTNLSGRYAMRFETASDVASALLAGALLGLGDAYVSQYPVRVAAVTREEAARAAARVLDPVNGVLVIVGDAKVVAPLLRAAGWPFEQVSSLDPISNWERKALGPSVSTSSESPVADPKRVAAAKKLLDQALAKKGGSARLQSLKSFHWMAEATLTMPSGSMAARMEKSYASPDKLQIDMRIGGGQMKIITSLTGRTGWAFQDSPRGKHVRDFSAPELASLSAQLWRDADLVLLRYREKGATIKPLGTRQIAGKETAAIEVVGPRGRTVTLLIDAKTKLLTGTDYLEQGQKTSERFSEYRKVAGLQVAHTRSTKSAQVDLKLKISKFEANASISDALFVRPPNVQPPNVQPTPPVAGPK